MTRSGRRRTGRRAALGILAVMSFPILAGCVCGDDPATAEGAGSSAGGT